MGTQITRAVVYRAVTIPSGQSESNAVNIEGGVILSFVMPDNWSTADLSFLGSLDGSNFYPVYDDEGVETKLASVMLPVNGGRVVVNSQMLEKLAALPWIKIRSGVNGAPVLQAGDRVWYIGVKG